MKTHKLMCLCIIGFYFLFSCTKSNINSLEEEPKIEETDSQQNLPKSESTYQFTLSGALKGAFKGVPALTVQSPSPKGDPSRTGLALMKFSLGENGSEDTEHHLLVEFNSENLNTSPLGLPFIRYF